MIIGAGEMGELTLKHLVCNGVSTVLVSNRSFHQAEALAGAYGGEAIRYDQLFSQLPRADIVISCTAAAHFVITAEKVRLGLEARGGRPLFFVDIAVPRDIEPDAGRIPGVFLYDIDDLEQVVLEQVEERRKAAQAAEEIVKEAVEEFLKWLSSLSVIPTIRALQQRAEQLKEEELQVYLQRLGKLDPKKEKLIRSLANSLLNKFLHTPIVRLKEYAGGHEGHLYSMMLEKLFDLPSEIVLDDTVPGRRRGIELGQIGQGDRQMRILRVGTRGSLLARRQTAWVIQKIRARFPDIEIEERIISTRGDLHPETPLPKLPQIGEKGLFTRELEAALLSGEIDLAVHSMKDLPTILPEGLNGGGGA